MRATLLLNLITATTVTASAASGFVNANNNHDAKTQVNTGLRGQRRLPGDKNKTTRGSHGGPGRSKQKHVNKDKGAGARGGFNLRDPVDDSAEENEMATQMAMGGQDETAVDRMHVVKKDRGRKDHHKEKGHKHKTETAAEDSYSEEDSRMKVNVKGKGKHSREKQQKQPKNEMKQKTKHIRSEAEPKAEREHKFATPQEKKKGRKHVKPAKEAPMDSRMKVPSPKGGSRTKKEKNAPAPSPKDATYYSNTPSPVVATVVTLEPTTASPTEKPTLSPTVDTEAVSPVDATTATDVEPVVYPPCPPNYNSSLAYAAGDEIGMNGHTFECRSAPYEEYCSIEEKDALWDDEQEMYWKKAWDHVGRCGEVDSEGIDESTTMTSTVANMEMMAESVDATTAYSAPVTTTVASIVMVAESVDTTTAAATTVASTTPNATSTTSATTTTTSSTSTTTEAETEAPTESPTDAPTRVPNERPITNWPTVNPTEWPSDAPTDAPVAATTTTTTTTTSTTTTSTTEEPTTTTTTATTTEEPTTTTTSATTTEELLTTTVVAAPEQEPSPTEYPTFMPTILTACPPAYDTTRIDYVAGQMTEVREHIFQCHLDDDDAGVSYERYCNAGEWDVALLESDPDARDHWNEAWVYVGGCDPELLMEEEVAEAAAEDEIILEYIEEYEESEDGWESDGVESVGHDSSGSDCTSNMCSYQLTHESLLRYKVNPAEGSVSMELVHDGEEWVGLAFSTNGEMIGSDAVIGLPTDVTVQKYSLFGKANSAVQPMHLEKQTLTQTSIQVINGQTVMKFTKLLHESGEIGIARGAVNQMLFAHGDGSVELGYHGPNSRMAFELLLP